MKISTSQSFLGLKDTLQRGAGAAVACTGPCSTSRRRTGWVKINVDRMGFIYGYESIPINSIFSGMNIHLPAILMFTRGTRVLTHPIYIYIHGILMDVNGIFMGFDVFLKDFHWISMG